MNEDVVILGHTGFVGVALYEILKCYFGEKVQGYNSSILDLTSRHCVDTLCERVNQNTTLIVTARSRQEGDRFKAFTDDVAIATNVAHLLSRRIVKKNIYFSTLSVYGDRATDLKITEETRIDPTSLYGIAKYSGECAIRYVTEKNGIPLLLLRPCKIYGPGDPSFTYGPVQFIQSILYDGKICLFGDGTELRDYIFIRDLVQIIIQLAFSNNSGTYNIATGQSCSFQDIIGYLKKVSKRNFEVQQKERTRPIIDQKTNVMKLVSMLPGFRFTPMEDGLVETYKFYADKIGER